MVSIREGRIIIDEAGHEIYYKLFGDGSETLMGLAGGPGCSHEYLLRLGELAGGDLQVLLYDQLGSGQSDRPDDNSLWNINRFAAEVNTVRIELGLRRVHLFGHSWGGWLALQTTLDYPEGIKSLICAGTSASVIEVLEGQTRQRLELPQDVQRTLLKYEGLQDWDNLEMREASMEFYARYIRRSTPFDPETSIKECQEILMPVLEDIGPAYESMWGPYEFICTKSLLDWDVRDRLWEIKVPTLVVGGYYDEVDHHCHRTLADGIADTEFVLLGQSSHWIILEKEADLYLGIIKNFVERAMAR